MDTSKHNCEETLARVLYDGTYCSVNGQINPNIIYSEICEASGQWKVMDQSQTYLVQTQGSTCGICDGSNTINQYGQVIYEIAPENVGHMGSAVIVTTTTTTQARRRQRQRRRSTNGNYCYKTQSELDGLSTTSVEENKAAIEADIANALVFRQAM